MLRGSKGLGDRIEGEQVIIKKIQRFSAARSVKAVFVLSVVAAFSAKAADTDALAQPQDTPLERQAAHYIQYRADVAAMEEKPFANAEATREAHKRLGTHDADDLTAGWVAYAALIAADTPEFAAALQEEIEPKKRRRKKRGELTGRDGFLSKLSQDPTYPRQLPGAQAAIDRVLAMTASDAERFTTLGEAFKTQAYAIQKTSWGRAKIKMSSSARLSEAETFAKSRPGPTMPSMTPATTRGVTAPQLSSLSDTMWQPDWGVAAAADQSAEQSSEAIMDRILNLAARYATGSVNSKIVEVYARNDKSNRCLSLSALTLKQCIAATRTSYEEAFCLGEHALNDVATCLGWVAGVDE